MSEFKPGDKIRVVDTKWRDCDYARPGEIGVVGSPAHLSGYVRVDLETVPNFPFRENEIELVEPVPVDTKVALIEAYRAHLQAQLEEDVATFAEAL